MRKQLANLILLCAVALAQGPTDVNKSTSVRYAGPGPTPTIDAQLKECGISLCVVIIDPQYTGPESSSILTTSMGYRVYGGSANTTVMDLRQKEWPVDTPLYPIQFGGRLAGQLTRFGVNYWSSGVVKDSAVAATFSNWISGATLPKNNGDLFGAVGMANTNGTITVGSSTSRVIGGDFEANVNATSADAPLPEAFGIAAAAHITRSDAAQRITVGGAAHLFGCGNASKSGAAFDKCYVLKLEPPGKSLTESYAMYSRGNWKSDNNFTWDIMDSAGAKHPFMQATPGNTIAYKPLSDSGGFNWYSQNGSKWLSLTEEQITLGRNVIIAGNVAPLNQSRGESLGTASNPWNGIYLARCTSATSPAVCNSAVTGFVNIEPSSTTVTIATTAVTDNSTITVQFDESLGPQLGVTCNNAAASEGATYFVSARTPGKSFSIKTNSAPTHLPACISFTIMN